MALNFNSSPYYDDFDPNKNFHRILFKPGFAVQARELTQSQTILQHQISKFADHIFQKNTPVSGCKLTLNTNSNYIKLNPTYNGASIDVTLFDGLIVQNSNGNVIAKVVAVSEATDADPTLGDPATLMVTYLSGEKFLDNDLVYAAENSSLVAETIVSGATGNGSVASISEGVFYVVNGFNISETTNTKYHIGNFVNVIAQSTILSKYDTTPDLRVGLNVVETIYDYVDDVSLLDPANGAPNYQGPGADRYFVGLTLETRTLTLGDDDGFIELMKIKDGKILKQVDGTIYATIDDYFAKRTFDTNGDYVVSDFKLTPSANANISITDTYNLGVGKGVAYVRGYRVENQAETSITSNRARTTDSINNNATYVEIGNYFYINNLNSLSGSLGITTSTPIDLHVVDSANVVSTNTSTYSRTVAASAYIRGIEFDHYTNVNDTSTYVYKAHVSDISNKTLTANVVSSGSSTSFVLPGLNFSDKNDAYVGVTVSIDKGPSAGDIKRIVSYVGATRTATVDSAFTASPTSASAFTLRFGIKDIESLVVANSTFALLSSSAISISSKDTGISTGNTVLGGIVSPELIYNLGYPYVASITDSSYTSTQMFRSSSFTSYLSTNARVTLNFDLGGPLLFLGTTPSNYIIINNTTGAVIPSSNVAVTLSNAGATATIVVSTTSPFTGTVICKTSISDALNSGHVLKIKDLIEANTTGANILGTTVNTYTKVDLTNGQVYISNAGLVTPGQAQSLYVSDIKRVVKIIDTGAPGTAATSAMLTDQTYDVSHNYSFDNGQRDTYYGHASIKLIPGRTAARGNLLVLFDYYEHGGGDGYFSGASYLSPLSAFPENYGEIPSYASKSGIVYSLRDALDFRPTQQNAQASFVFDYTSDPASSNSGQYLPIDNTTFTTDYTYYLARKDKLILTKDKNFQIIEGVPSINPLLPVEPDGALVIANLTLDPYTTYIPGEVSGVFPSLSIEKVKHKRWTMSDISDLQTRVNSIEYYTALNNLEKTAQSQQVPDVNGLNRFKNGILVDDFSSFSTTDTGNIDFNASINRRTKQLTASQIVDNFPLQSTYSSRLGSADATALGFSVKSVGKSSIYTLPYTTVNLVNQPLASNTVNINQFATPISQGIMSLNPPMDNWVDNTKQPDLLIVDQDLQLFRSSDTLNTLSTGDWKVIPGTTATTTSSTSVNRTNHGAFNGVFGNNVGQTETTTTTQTYQSSSQTTISGFYDKLGSSYSQDGGYITDISVLPYIRQQSLLFKSKGMLVNSPVSAWFDGVKVNDYIYNPDIIELTGVTGTFLEDDIIGYYESSVFYPIATVVSAYVYPGTSNVRLYIAGNVHTSFASDLPISKIQNATFNSSGVYNGTTANGTVSSTRIVNVHKTGYVSTTGGSFVDVASSTVQYFKVNVGHGAFAGRYGIWGSPRARGNLPAGKFNFTAPTSGTYYVRVSVDDAQSGYIKVNGTSIWTVSGTSGANYDYSVTLTAGSNNVEFSMTTSQDDGDAYMALAISSDPWSGTTTTAGTVVFESTKLSWTSAPTNSGTMTELDGGGLYFVGTTQLALSGLASDTTNFYVGSTIKINTSFISRNPISGEYSVQPSTYTSTVSQYIAANTTVVLSSPVNISLGSNSHAGGDITSFYTLDGTYNSYNLAKISGGLEKLSTDESGSFVGIFNIPSSTFKTGERLFRVDNRTTANDPNSASTFSEATFTASGLSTKSQSINFSPSIDSAKNTFTQTKYQQQHLISTRVTYNPYDPVAQSFIVDSSNYPNGVFLNSIKVFFQSKPADTTNLPVTLSIVGTQNGYPNGSTLDNSIVTMYPNKVRTSLAPHYLDSTTYTEFVFQSPVYIQPNTLYAFILKTASTDYKTWIAAQNAIAVSSTVKNLPTDVTPSTITKIGTAPYVGSLFESQNAMTWTADQGKSLMFTLERCVFDITKHPKLPFVVPQNLPYRKLTSQDIQSYYNANNISNVFGTYAGKDVLSDAYNITTTDFIPSTSTINYTYKSTLNDSINTVTSEMQVSPGKFGCPTYDDIYLNDGQGERTLVATSNTSFVLYSTLSSNDDTVSPMLSDDGLSLYNIRWNINNMELSNSTVSIANTGTGYDISTTTVTVSAPDDINGVQAYATANISGGTIQSVDFITVGSGYLTTPTITIADAGTRSGNTDAIIVVHGETGTHGGNGISKYITKKVVLTPGNDSGDLRVYYTAYRPLNSNISVYYKILSRNDNQEFDDSNWQLMTTVTNSLTYSNTRDDVYEFECAPGTNGVADDFISYTGINGQTYTSFSQFAIKIVLSTSDNTSVPYLSDIRALALPSGTGL